MRNVAAHVHPLKAIELAIGDYQKIDKRTGEGSLSDTMSSFVSRNSINCEIRARHCLGTGLDQPLLDCSDGT